MSHQPFVQLNSRDTSIIVNCTGKQPQIIYWGKKLTQLDSIDPLIALAQRQEAKCAPEVEPILSLTPCYGDGFVGAPGLELRSLSNNAWMFSGHITYVAQSNGQSIIEMFDNVRNVKVVYQLQLDYESNVFSASTEIVNHSSESIEIDWCASLTIPLQEQFDTIYSFEGRWANEFRRHKLKRFMGGYLKENRKGKTSHDNFPGVVLSSANTSEAHGECFGFHLGWSGNHRTRVESLSDGRNFVQLGELLHPGEVRLKEGESYQTPSIYVSYSNLGLSNLSNNFHNFVRSKLLTYDATQKVRPIHYNTWEAIYFDHSYETLKELVEKAAKLGAERFVLDDGWFKGRRDDTAGLGDWTVDESIYPQGLNPLIKAVNDNGMEFGIWFEPEMVNPDSDLYRKHPEWILQAENCEQIKFRNQYVLDLTRPEVTDYLDSAISDILEAYPQITYIKWDMNRDINHANNALGYPAVHKQTLALYSLIQNLKGKFPHVEIESCSSGGARVDYGILRYTDRVWTSDSNDALDRLSIQKGCSFFFPSEVMGSHVGPRDCHITGRNISIEMRTGVALFGHMGMEMDPRELTDHEAKVLSDGFALHKANRHLIHGGNLVRLDSQECAVNFGIVAKDQSEALYAHNLITEYKGALPPSYFFIGLDQTKNYRIERVWPIEINEYRESGLSKLNGQVFSGEHLVNFGMQLPIILPQSLLVFKLTEVK
ncbi:glycoside hydrolase, clan GH-D [Catenovulum agarivorans DS-2]|uniref:Alpha-galactosidase n=1 Tax=Catenovulum agarivorans DS-2 TaxID=1328313 RepID=W7QE62_9ALTE|nr:alpha-galactosidase [Catenovulum agarivorans]EWH10211.1 glycoside hydrolase, clan GH-D [Catenovulum agarivorans DS-2]